MKRPSGEKAGPASLKLDRAIAIGSASGSRDRTQMSDWVTGLGVT